MSLAFLGCLILWLGWLGLVGGQELALTPKVPSLLLTINLAAGAAGAVAMLTGWLRSGKPDLALTISGVLAGLVAISGSCNQISSGAALFVGAIAGLLVVGFLDWFDRVHLDDATGMLSVHLVGGLWGTLAVGIFDLKAGLIRGQLLLLLNQLIGIAVIGVFMILFSGLLWLLLKVSIGLRVDLEEEINGLDFSEHRQSAYPEFLMEGAGSLRNPYEPVVPLDPMLGETKSVQQKNPGFGEWDAERMGATLESDESQE